jgi:multidrug efflux system outer membrane protein
LPSRNAPSVLLAAIPPIPGARHRPLTLPWSRRPPVRSPERRPDIRQAEQNLISANALIGVAKEQYFPSISLTGLFGWSSTDISRLFVGPAQTWNWAAQIATPIFTGGAIYGQVKSAEAFQQQLLITYQQTIQNAFRDVNDALIDRKNTMEQLQTQGKQVDSLENYYRMAWLRYENGYTSYIEVLDAERSLFNAQLSEAQIKGFPQSVVNIYKAIEGLLEKMTSSGEPIMASPSSSTERKTQ